MVVTFLITCCVTSLVDQANIVFSPGELKPVIGNNSSGENTMFAWSTKEVTQQVIKKQIQSDKIDAYTLENEDILSEDIAQSNINAETIKNKTIAEVGGKAILPMGAF